MREEGSHPAGDGHPHIWENADANTEETSAWTVACGKLGDKVGGSTQGQPKTRSRTEAPMTL